MKKAHEKEETLFSVLTEHAKHVFFKVPIQFAYQS